MVHLQTFIMARYYHRWMGRHDDTGKILSYELRLLTNTISTELPTIMEEFLL